jgi:hypothetical protein
MSKQVIICKYKENINWVHQLTCDYLIHNKSGESLNIPNVINLPNHPEGRDTHSIIYHLYHNYDNLADETIFLQGNPFPHYHIRPKYASCIIEAVNRNHKELLYPFGPLFNATNIQNTEYDRLYRQLFDEPIPECIIWFGGSQFHISKECVHLRPITFYQKCWETFNEHWGYKNENEEGHPDKLVYLYEKLWLYIFLPQHKYLQKIYLQSIKEHLKLCHIYEPYRYINCPEIV